MNKGFSLIVNKKFISKLILMPYFTISRVTEEAIYLKPLPKEKEEEAKKEERKYMNSYNKKLNLY